MSRTIFYSSEPLTIINGIDQIFGEFYQIYDKRFLNETPEGEGLVLDWSANYGFNINLTELSNSLPITELIMQYIKNTTEEMNDELNNNYYW